MAAPTAAKDTVDSAMDLADKKASPLGPPQTLGEHLWQDKRAKAKAKGKAKAKAKATSRKVGQSDPTPSQRRAETPQTLAVRPQDAARRHTTQALETPHAPVRAKSHGESSTAKPPTPGSGSTDGRSRSPMTGRKLGPDLDASATHASEKERRTRVTGKRSSTSGKKRSDHWPDL